MFFFFFMWEVGSFHVFFLVGDSETLVFFNEISWAFNGNSRDF